MLFTNKGLGFDLIWEILSVVLLYLGYGYRNGRLKTRIGRPNMVRTYCLQRIIHVLIKRMLRLLNGMLIFVELKNYH